MRQTRSQVTVAAVFEAPIQVLLSDGPRRLTTTRVAERAGVSVGTLYQYYPNKQALLYAVLERHLQRVGDSVAAAARASHHAPLAAMVSTVVDAFVRAKTERIDESRALYSVANELDSTALVRSVGQRSCEVMSAMLATASDAHFADLSLTSFIVVNAMVGPTRAMLEAGAPPKLLRALRGQLTALCLGYLERAATAQSLCASVTWIGCKVTYTPFACEPKRTPVAIISDGTIGALRAWCPHSRPACRSHAR